MYNCERKVEFEDIDIGEMVPDFGSLKFFCILMSESEGN